MQFLCSQRKTQMAGRSFERAKRPKRRKTSCFDILRVSFHIHQGKKRYFAATQLIEYKDVNM